VIPRDFFSPRGTNLRDKVSFFFGGKKPFLGEKFFNRGGAKNPLTLAGNFEGPPPDPPGGPVNGDQVFLAPLSRWGPGGGGGDRRVIGPRHARTGQGGGPWSHFCFERTVLFSGGETPPNGGGGGAPKIGRNRFGLSPPGGPPTRVGKKPTPFFFWPHPSGHTGGWPPPTTTEGWGGADLYGPNGCGENRSLPWGTYIDCTPEFGPGGAPPDFSSFFFFFPLFFTPSPLPPRLFVVFDEGRKFFRPPANSVYTRLSGAQGWKEHLSVFPPQKSPQFVGPKRNRQFRGGGPRAANVWGPGPGEARKKGEKGVFVATFLRAPPRGWNGGPDSGAPFVGPPRGAPCVWYGFSGGQPPAPNNWTALFCRRGAGGGPHRPTITPPPPPHQKPFFFQRFRNRGLKRGSPQLVIGGGGEGTNPPRPGGRGG